MCALLSKELLGINLIWLVLLYLETDTKISILILPVLLNSEVPFWSYYGVVVRK